LLRNFSREKLATFLEQLDPTSIWFFLCIHDTIRDPLVEYLLWKSRTKKKKLALEEEGAAKKARVEEET
jgi:hypothetical protein